VSYAVDDAHRRPLHGSAVAARAAPGTYRQTDGQTQRRFNTPNLRPGPQNLKIDRVILITPTWGTVIGRLGLYTINQYTKFEDSSFSRSEIFQGE